MTPVSIACAAARWGSAAIAASAATTAGSQRPVQPAIAVLLEPACGKPVEETCNACARAGAFNLFFMNSLRNDRVGSLVVQLRTQLRLCWRRRSLESKTP